MDEEEKKAINDLKRTVELYEAKPIDKISVEFDEFDYKIVKIVLNLIEKLQKENEELEEINNELEAEKNEAIRRYNFETIPIQKVKDKIEELKVKLEDISKRREKSKTKEEETVLWCLEIRTDERIKTLQELLDKMDQNQ